MRRKQRGQSLFETGIAVGVIATGLILGIGEFGKIIDAVFEALGFKIEQSTNCIPALPCASRRDIVPGAPFVQGR
jgi:hypothetical protein